MRTNHSVEGQFTALVHQLGPAGDLPAPPVVRSELAAIFEHGVQSSVLGVLGADLPIHTRRRKMLTALSTALATLTGKVVLGTAIAAASVGAAHSAGVVDVPGLPDTAPAVESPAVDNPGSEHSTGQPSDTGDSPGVDGSEVADRATSGEPQEDGKEFGTSIAEEATEGTPAEGRIDGSDTGQSGTPAGGAETADQYKPDTPAGDSSTADEHVPDTEPAGSDAADEYLPDETPATNAPADHP